MSQTSSHKFPIGREGEDQEGFAGVLMLRTVSYEWLRISPTQPLKHTPHLGNL